MNTIELRIDEKQNSTYCVHLLGTDTKSEFELRFDLAEKQELQHIMQGISHGDAEEEFEIKLKNYGNKLYNYLSGCEMTTRVIIVYQCYNGKLCDQSGTKVQRQRE